MQRALVAVVGLFLGVGHLTTPAVAEDWERIDKAIRAESAKVVGEWLELATRWVGEGRRGAAQRALERARRLDPAAEGLRDLMAKAEALAPAADQADATATADEECERAAKGYEKLAKTLPKSSGDARHGMWLLEAYLASPSKKRLAAVAALATQEATLLRSSNHPLAALVSLPKGWKPGGSYPVLVSVEGAGANFIGNANQFRGARGSRNWILVSPHALSCMNEIEPPKFPAYDKALLDMWGGKRVDFDVPGLLALLDLVHEHFGGEKQTAITGFSGGGNLCYGFLLRHPERVLAAAPACANFNPGLANGVERVNGGGPPVHVMTGEKDPHRHMTHGKFPPGIEEQTDDAMAALADRGFENVKRTMWPGKGHVALAAEVYEFVDAVRENAKK